jgi:hypothetical protein
VVVESFEPWEWVEPAREAEIGYLCAELTKSTVGDISGGKCCKLDEKVGDEG